MKKVFLLIAWLMAIGVQAEEKKVLLYYSDSSSSSKRVKWAMNYKDIAYQLVDVSPLSEEYRKINPMKKVPALYIDGRTLSQSVAILEYLEDTRPQPPLLPADPYQKAIVKQLVQMIACDIQPLQNGAVLLRVDNGREWARFWIERGFRGVEVFLSQHAGIYSVGNTLTMADFFLYPQILNARKYGVDLEQYPNISRIGKLLDKESWHHS